MTSYNWQHPDWPNFEYDLAEIQNILYRFALETSYLAGGLKQLPDSIQMDALIDIMVLEAINTSEIEGERFDPEDVRSSLCNHLGLTEQPYVVKDPRTLGITELMISIRQTFREPLTEELMFLWHKMLMTDLRSGQDIEIGKWRTSVGPMQIVSGPIGHENVHFEAPPSQQLSQEMSRFIKWFNDTQNVNDNTKIPGPVRAAIAHLYFESIHPFADGNGRIGRAIAEKVLSQDLQYPVLLSLSTRIEKERKRYYRELSLASRGNLNITRWIKYFVETIYHAQLDTKMQINFILEKVKFWEKYTTLINSRQKKVLARMLKQGIKGFEGGISAQKYMKMSDCSKATATRDLAELVDYGCIMRLPGRGRSTRYQIKDINFLSHTTDLD